MGTFNKNKLSDSNVLSIVLSGLFEEDERIVYCNDLERQLENILFESREHPIIEGHYHFVTAGAFPWSREVRAAYSVLLIGTRYLGWLSPGPDYVERGMKRLAEITRDEKGVSEADYNFLTSLGKKIEVVRRG